MAANMLHGTLFRHNIQPLLTIAVRGRRRDHAQKQLAKRLQKRREAANQPVKESILSKVVAQKSKSSASISQEHPARIELPADLSERPASDEISWCIDDYKPYAYSVSEAVKHLRRVNQPSILNRLDSYVFLRLDLNMNLEKANKYVADTTKVLVLPHPYPHSERRLIMALAQEVPQQAEAAEAGAEIVGGPEIIKKIVKGTVRVDEVDYVACHINMLSEIGPLRGLLKHRYPTVKNGGIASELAPLIKHFQFGVNVNVKQDSANLKYGVSTNKIGQLNWPDNKLEENINAVIQTVCELRPVTPKLGHFIARALLIVPPEKDYFIIDHVPYSPAIPVDIPEEAPKKKSKKAARETIAEPVAGEVAAII